ncbi:MAG TPA: sodium ion-translocating decarboxylase subunit beta [Candidatus Kapabacteria bacterium]|mgnify:FL=1|nr:sodium ion-translocating decarboxylase subunit beta [Candidatus Kapabacteria bacterium]HOM04938.1 sodium ion-translocating decarboxylase subunit beta [Candidatus Kapabacteria bacterium]HPU24100.1 sodium ion-translocating decarboxylase subunit beta [Candidatus Kapabacteria bacterium]
MFENLMRFVEQMGFWSIGFPQLIMFAISGILMYLAIVKGFEPLLLLPISFGAILANLPNSGLLVAPVIEMINGEPVFREAGGLYYWISKGIKLEIFPPLIFLGIGAMTDFGPLLSNPKTFLLGAAAQLGVFAAFIFAVALGFTFKEAASIGIIGGADGPTAIYLTSKLAPHLLGPIAVAAYSYMALVPLIQPPIMKLLTTDAERKVVMELPKQVSKRVKILFPIIVMVFSILVVPPTAPLIAMLMGGNLLRESGVVERLAKMASNELINIVTFFLGTAVGITMAAESFLRLQTIFIIILGVIAFGMSTVGGVLMGKIMYKLTGGKVNPLIGSAGVSAVPMAARVSHNVGLEYNKHNYLLMHAMGPNVAGVIGSAIAAGILLAIFK